MSRITYTERGHKYTLDGEQVPSVTKIIDDGLRKVAIEEWGKRTVAEFVSDHLTVRDGEFVADATELLTALERAAAQEGRSLDPGSRASATDVLKRVPYLAKDTAANRGIEVHDIAHRIIGGEEVDVPGDIERHVAALLQWIDDWQPSDELAEHAVANVSLQYCGRFDLIATLCDGQRWLIDYKTNRTGVYAETALQLAGYRFAEIIDIDGDDEPMPGVDRTGVVWLSKEGYRFYEVDTGPFVWAAFQRMRRQHDYLVANHQPRKSPLLRELTAFDRADAAS